ncbi:MAG TPA: cupin domain-containing protein [Pararhizobium sp.]|nr:cupin domain-containing protein [Pararhizobium sp.]
MGETIHLGAIELRFLQTKDGTGDSLDVFEMTLQPEGRMPVAHYHESWDETVYGLSGVTTWTVDGKEIALTPGETAFIRRGVVHGFSNKSGETAKCLCILTPGKLGTAYFREVADMVAAGAPDPVRMEEIMLRHGLVPVPAPAA